MRYALRVMGVNGDFAWLGPGPFYPYKPDQRRAELTRRARHHVWVINCYMKPIAMSKKECLEVRAFLLDANLEIMRYPAARVVHRLVHGVYNSCVSFDKEKYESKYGKKALQESYGSVSPKRFP